MFNPKSHIRSPRNSGALAALLVVAACEAPQPASLAPLTGATFSTADDGTLVGQQAPATAEEAMKAAIERYYPAVLHQGMGRRTHVYFIANAQGEMEKTAIDTDPPVYGNIGIPIRAKFPDVDFKTAEMTGVQIFAAGKMGPDTVVVFFVQRKAAPGTKGMPARDVFLFTRGREFTSEPVLRTAVERHQPSALLGEIKSTEEVWFVVNDRDEVLASGVGPVSTDSQIARKRLEERFPGIEIGRVTMTGSVKTATGHSIHLIWAKLKSGSVAR